MAPSRKVWKTTFPQKVVPRATFVEGSVYLYLYIEFLWYQLGGVPQVSKVCGCLTATYIGGSANLAEVAWETGLAKNSQGILGCLAAADVLLMCFYFAALTLVPCRAWFIKHSFNLFLWIIFYAGMGAIPNQDDDTSPKFEKRRHVTRFPRRGCKGLWSWTINIHNLRHFSRSVWKDHKTRFVGWFDACFNCFLVELFPPRIGCLTF